MQSIWKYTLEITDLQILEIPAGAEILTVQMQRGQPRIWVLVDTTVQKEIIKIHTAGTGHPVSDAVNLKYIGTYQSNDLLVFHVFKETTILDEVKEHSKG